MINLGLQRISALLAETPLPWRAIHVAGTNGKGSICAYVSAMLSAYHRSNFRKQDGISWSNFIGLRHGRFTSPHLIDRSDCVSIDEKPVESSLFNKMESDVLKRNESLGLDASEFELLTATAFKTFTERRLHVSVVEVGLGGRLDATNILGLKDGLDLSAWLAADDPRPMPLVSVISSIGLDHQAFLGNSLENIATEKAGIIKPGVPVVYDHSNPHQVIGAIRSMAEAKGSPIIESSGQGASVPPKGTTPETFNHQIYLHESINSLVSVDGSPLPKHTKQNITLAYLATWSALQQLGRVDVQKKTLSDKNERSKLFNLGAELADDMLQVATKVQFQGRQQRISIEKLTSRQEDVLLDGAHNARSAIALADAVWRLRNYNTHRGQGKKVTWVLAASDSKDVKEILAPLIKDGDTILAVEFGPVDGMPWVKPLSASNICEAAKAVVSQPESLSVQDCGRDVLNALKWASGIARGGPIVIAGSLYLVGDALRLLRDA